MRAWERVDVGPLLLLELSSLLDREKLGELLPSLLFEVGGKDLTGGLLGNHLLTSGPLKNSTAARRVTRM